MILPKAELTPSGRPKLLAGEVERVLLDKVDIEFEEAGCTEGCAQEAVYKSGYCVVTSHRLLWVDAVAAPASGRSCHLPLDTIHSVHKRTQFGLNVMNPKVRLEVKLFVDRNFKVANMQASVTFKHINLRCRGEAPDAFKDTLTAAMHAHKQVVEQQQQQQQRLQQQHPAGGGSSSPHSTLQQQQQQPAPWAAAFSGPVSHPISGGLTSGSFSTHNLHHQQQHQQQQQQQWLQQQQQQQQQVLGPPHHQQVAAAAASRVGVQAVDGELLGQLTDMGFPRPRVVRALLATHNEHLQAALDWILAAGDDPTLDAPLPVPQPAVVSRAELMRLKQLNMLQEEGQGQQPAGLGFGNGGQQQQQQQLNPGWGMGSVSSAAALGGGGAAAAGGASWGSGGGQRGSWSAVGPLTAGLGSSGGGGSSPRKSNLSPAAAAATSPSGAAGAGAGAGAGGGPIISSSRMVGVAGIMTREAEKTSQTAANLAAAFQDLDNLMGMAAEMVKLAEKFRGVMGADGAITLNPNSNSNSNSSINTPLNPASGSFSTVSAAGGADTGAAGSGGGAGAAGGSNSDLLLDSETQLQLIAMGITSPVTRASAGVRYHQELSRQLADFLAVPLSKAGGVLMLPDVYCLFNRARGTELVSPDDLMQACDAFAQVGLPLRLRKFPSGVLVVQGAQFSDQQLCRNIEQLLQRKSQTGADTAGAIPAAAAPPAAAAASSSYVPGLGPALSAADVSAALLLPLTLAKEALLVAESAGVLCRDDGPEGLRFFRNFYKEAQPVAFC